jgi:hypothetical protein
MADSLSAIKYAKVTPIRDEKGLAVDFKVGNHTTLAIWMATMMCALRSGV